MNDEIQDDEQIMYGFCAARKHPDADDVAFLRAQHARVSSKAAKYTREGDFNESRGMLALARSIRVKLREWGYDVVPCGPVD